MRILFLFLASVLAIPFAQAQIFWADANPDALAIPESAKLEVYPTHFRTLELDLASVQSFLAKAPREFTTNARAKALTLELPFPDGRMEAFKVVESPVMKPGLAARYPMIKTFAAYSATGKPYSARFDYTTLGFHAIIRTDEGTIYIDPYAEGQTQFYMSYFTKDYDLDALGIPALGCGWQPGEADHPIEEETGLKMRGLEQLEETPVNLRVYDMALACTGEYGQAKGGTVEAVMSTFNTAINRVNEILMPEAAIKFELIENDDLLIFLNPNTDPYVNSNAGLDLVNQNTSAINNIINVNTYDIGHLFTLGCTDVGGVSGGQGTVCTQNKAKGVTCHASSNIIHIAEEIMAHELAHQLGASHTWSNCPGWMGQLDSSSSFEPGSGTTIMSYAGGCGPENIQFGSDVYYHVHSLMQMHQYTTVGPGSECPDIVPTDNREPVIDMPYENGFYIPISTPFELKASATDPDGDPLTYCWEQYDLGPVASLGSPVGDSPLFRSFPPAAAPNRTFPRLPAILGNFAEDVEILPTYSRNLIFRLTVRDNYPGGGGTDWAQVKFKSTDQAGPFVVTYPNTVSDQLTGGTFDTITWDVASTDKAPVNCQKVNILLSVDGGYTYPYTLVAATPNTGSAVVAIPNITSNTARIRVEAADNIFFDLSNSNFKILAPTEPGFTFQVDAPLVQTICIPNEVEVPFSSQSILGFDSLLTIELLSGLPAGAIADFSATQFLPGTSTILSLDLNQVSGNQDAELLVRLTSTAGDTMLFPLFFHLISEDFSALAMATPLNGESGLDINEAIFTWTDLSNAESYDFQLATSPDFSPESMVHQKSGLTVSTYVPPVVLEKNELYYWRIRAGNQCRTIDYLPPAAFHTIVLACDVFMSNDVPMGIPSLGTPTRTSELTILKEGTINDVNVVNLVGYHEGIQELRVSLQGPDGTMIKLFGEYCGSSAPFNMDLDDESPFNPPCPPNTGQAYKPAEPLNVFDGQNTAGTWKLVAKVVDEWGNGGLIETWGLEFCASFTPKNPYLVNNKLLQVQPGGTRHVYNESLLVQDEDNTAEELTYTLVTPPQHGTLVWYNEALSAGGQFRQISINAGNVWYVHSGDGSETDSFSFVVEDGTGGWLGITTFEIEVNPNAPIATKELPGVQPLRIYPNPSSGFVRVAFPDLPFGEVEVQVVNALGQTLLQQRRQVANNGLDLDMSAWPDGLYLVLVGTEEGRFAGRVEKY